MCAQFDLKWSMIILGSKTRTYLGKLVNHSDPSICHTFRVWNKSVFLSLVRLQDPSVL